ncbi:antA/AntB antirepressor family protein [Corynebacterium kalidii]|uniref:AntA/AntB antirepressor family protein n=1 Tax=Corynebacterium kalidii TaxID=2931982 RepID=A0A9X2B2L9_9CORY|nr:antA/AntB antirepressor family protein [Corynebacterium kalidii]MCJ7859229.1 antA/AntB antirepressor family protein [Corynebacterium kalidii]
MSDLIPITQTDDGRQAVSGRALHQFLEVGAEYRHWLPRMVAYGFTEGQDYTVISDRVARQGRGTVERQDHILTLDMAKEVSMIQRNEKGRQARAYFLECEKRAQSPVAALPDRRALAQMVIEAEDRADKATAELAAAAPAIEYHDRFIADDQDVITVEDWGRQWGLSRPQAFDLLTGRKVIFRKSVTREFSNKAGEVVDRNEYRPYSDYRNLFDLRPQHNAPRYHNGQVRQTLYVKAAASFLLANAMKLPGTPGGEQVSA